MWMRRGGTRSGIDACSTYAERMDGNPRADHIVQLRRHLLELRLCLPGTVVSLARVMGPPDCQRDGTTVARY